MDRRRIIVVLLFFFLLPAACVAIVLAAGHTGLVGWVVCSGILVGGYVLLVALIVGSGRAGKRTVAVTRAAHPDALFVHRAVDASAGSRIVQLLVADPAGISLNRGRGERIRPSWSVPWENVRGAETTLARFRTGRKPAVVIHLRTGSARTIGLPGTYGLGNPAALAREVADRITSRCGAAEG